ncbi:hypothetical protein D3C81_1451350 [compost metagenome]
MRIIRFILNRNRIQIHSLALHICIEFIQILRILIVHIVFKPFCCRILNKCGQIDVIYIRSFRTGSDQFYRIGPAIYGNLDVFLAPGCYAAGCFKREVADYFRPVQIQIQI